MTLWDILGAHAKNGLILTALGSYWPQSRPCPFQCPLWSACCCWWPPNLPQCQSSLCCLQNQWRQQTPLNVDRMQLDYPQQWSSCGNSAAKANQRLIHHASPQQKDHPQVECSPECLLSVSKMHSLWQWVIGALMNLGMKSLGGARTRWLWIKAVLR